MNLGRKHRSRFEKMNSMNVFERPDVVGLTLAWMTTQQITRSSYSFVGLSSQRYVNFLLLVLFCSVSFETRFRYLVCDASWFEVVEF